MLYHILSFMLLAALNHGRRMPGRSYCRPQALPTINDHQQALRGIEPHSPSVYRNVVRLGSFSVPVSTNPSTCFSPVSETPMATTIVMSAQVFPSRKTATRASALRSRSGRALSCVALPCVKARDTVELDKPMAQGTAAAS